jgi:hypothetical protein
MHILGPISRCIMRVRIYKDDLDRCVASHVCLQRCEGAESIKGALSVECRKTCMGELVVTKVPTRCGVGKCSLVHKTEHTVRSS